MPRSNNHNMPRRARGKSCPAGVTFAVNDIAKYKSNGTLRKWASTNLHLAKEYNFTRHRSFPSTSPNDKLDSRGSFPSAEDTHALLLNYSILTGGKAYNSFCCKLDEAHSPNHSSVDICHQHTVLNKSTVHESSNLVSFRNELLSEKTLKAVTRPRHRNPQYVGLNEYHVKSEDISPSKASGKAKPEDVKYNPFDLLKVAENFDTTFDETDEQLDYSLLGGFLQEVSTLEVTDFSDNCSRLIQNRLRDDPVEVSVDKDVRRLASHVHGTEILVENLANEVEATKRDIEMSKRKQENEINDLISLNEEMQTIWSEKDSEVREILERFSAYRDAVDADSKEKDEIYAEEVNKREVAIRELQFTRNALEDELRLKNEAIREIINDVENFEATHCKQLVDVNQLVACLLETFSDQEAGVVCQNISVKLETSIATIKEKDYTRYVNCLNISRQTESTCSEELNTSHIRAEELKRHYRDSQLGKSFSSSVDEGRGYSILSSPDGERNDNFFSENAANGSNNEQFSSQVFSSCAPPIGNAEFYETLEEDFLKLLKGIEDYDSDIVIDGHIDRKIVIKLFEEQRSRYQYLCKEKDDEIQHWMRKHKQDTKDLQSILEEQERAEAKTRESLTESQNEIDKLQQKIKFLESEIEFEKEQVEDDVCYLKESFQKDLSAQLRRQSQSFLSVEESTKNQIAELESTNEELRKSNDDLRRQIAGHCTEIKSWVSDILLLSEEERNEEFDSITAVLAKLQKIIIENKHTMDALQEELNEHRSKGNEPSSPTDTYLSRSWGGHSWNSMELPVQKEFCRHCKQTKWQRVLMGSFDLVETSLDERQEEVERFVHKLSVDEPKNRKRHSLKDSLELADTQVQEHLQRLSRMTERDSLETLGEDSIEEDVDSIDDRDLIILDDINSISSEDRNSADDGDSKSEGCDNFAGSDKYDGQSGLEQNSATSSEKNLPQSGNQSWQNIHVSPRVLKQISILSDPEFDNSRKPVGGDGESNECGRRDDKETSGVRSQDEQANRDVELICEENLQGKDGHWGMEQDKDGQWGVEHDNDGQWGMEQDSDGQEEDQDRVHVVNLYRSLIVESNAPQHVDFVDGKNRDKIDGESGDQCTESGNQTAYENDNTHNDTAVARAISFPIPKITVETDCNDNILDTQEHDDENGNVEESKFDEISNKIGYEEEARSEDYNVSLSNIKVEAVATCGIDSKRMLQHELSDEVFIRNTVESESKISESWTISNDARNSIFEFTGNFQDEPPPATTCDHCTKLFSETFETFKSKIMEAILSRRIENGNRILEELLETKTELRECQSGYEKLEKVCEDYRNYVDEYSGNLKRKNEELRKLKLSSGVMKTEIEWLRQALRITRDYVEF